MQKSFSRVVTQTGEIIDDIAQVCAWSRSSGSQRGGFGLDVRSAKALVASGVDVLMSLAWVVHDLPISKR